MSARRFIVVALLAAVAAAIYPTLCAYRRRRRWADAWAGIPESRIDQFVARLDDWTEARPTPAPLDAVQVLADVQAFLNKET